MQKIIYKNEKLGENYTEATHPSGLKIYLCKREKFTTSYAVFGTKYGSVDSLFKLDDETDFTKVPDGIAHFLEHKLFEQEDGSDVSDLFSKTGAMSNAFTSFDRTSYLFSCSENLSENLAILLDFVQQPYFTEKSVEKEQGIIAQEIEMYNDISGWRVFFNLLQAMYHNHSVRIDIAGTVESIGKIDHNLLYKCYETFYNPKNMYICIAGNINVDEILTQINDAIKLADGKNIIRGEYDEPNEIAQTKIQQELAVATPIFALGYKERTDVDYNSLKARVMTDIILEIIFGETSNLYNKLLNDGLINDNFSFSYFCGDGYGACLIDGESKDVELVQKLINAEIAAVKSAGLNEDDALMIKRKLYGGAIRAFNSNERIASMLTDSYINNENMFDAIEIYDKITPEDLSKRLSEILNVDNSSISIINPVK